MEEKYTKIGYVMNEWWKFFFYCSHACAKDRSWKGRRAA
jgi:hypothetical protein